MPMKMVLIYMGMISYKQHTSTFIQTVLLTQSNFSHSFSTQLDFFSHEIMLTKHIRYNTMNNMLQMMKKYHTLYLSHR